jgi:hypothetical protein
MVAGQLSEKTKIAGSKKSTWLKTLYIKEQRGATLATSNVNLHHKKIKQGSGGL